MNLRFDVFNFLAIIDTLSTCRRHLEYTFLHVLVTEKGHAEIVALLLAHGAWENHTDILKALLEKGASVDARDENGWTAMMRAAVKGHNESMMTLLEKGADVNAGSSAGDTALIRAAQGGQIQTVKALLERGRT